MRVGVTGGRLAAVDSLWVAVGLWHFAIGPDDGTTTGCRGVRRSSAWSRSALLSATQFGCGKLGDEEFGCGLRRSRRFAGADDPCLRIALAACSHTTRTPSTLAVHSTHRASSPRPLLELSSLPHGHVLFLAAFLSPVSFACVRIGWGFNGRELVSGKSHQTLPYPCQTYLFLGFSGRSSSLGV
jgi:hypothetical protein